MSADQPLTGDELATIKARAEAATPGPWEDVWSDFRGLGAHSVKRGDLVVAFVGYESHEGDRPNDDAEHIAGMDPATTLRLVAEIERLQAQVERVEKFQQGLVVLGNMPIEKREDGLTGGIEACAALANDLRVTLDGP